MIRSSFDLSIRSRCLAAVVVTVAGIALPGAALAHTGLGVGGFASGFVHPFSGLDHLLAMFAVGLWAARLGGRATWLIPTTFVLTMVVAAASAVGGLPLPLVEVGVAGSVVVLGAVIALDTRLPLASALPLVAALAIFHGYAHGAELPAAVSGVTYGLGFMLATAALHGWGIAGGLLANRLAGLRPVQAGGGAITLAGLWMLAGL